jgi:hypothetical protein
MSCKQNDEFFEMRRENTMHEYQINYISEQLENRTCYMDAVGMSEVMDSFIETYCPVHSIVSIVKVQPKQLPQSRETRPA